MTGNHRMIKLGYDIINFFNTEVKMLQSNEKAINNSSDIIESVFGTYKARKSPNKLYGVTPFILFIPAHTLLIKNKNAKHFIFKERLERISLKNIDSWAAENLTTNLVMKRTLNLKRAG